MVVLVHHPLCLVVLIIMQMVSLFINKSYKNVLILQIFNFNILIIYTHTFIQYAFLGIIKYL